MAYTTINKPSDYFRIKLYAGNATNDTAITWDETDTNMQPDWLWIKSRTDTQSPCIFDSVRGALKRLISAEANAEGDEATNLDSFDTNGFQVDGEAIVNGGSRNYVAWGWKGGTAFSNDASSTSIGDIDSSGTVNTAAGFSVIKATSDGAANKDIAHGLGAVPDVIISKNRERGYNWDVYFKVLGYNAALQFNTTAVPRTGAWGSNAFTTTTFETYEDYSSKNGEGYIYYCFAEKQGYTKFGKYVGNGDPTNGPTIYTGFKPAWVIFKRTDSTDQWMIVDNKRNPFNEMTNVLRGDATNAEESSPNSYAFDFLSNGFRLKDDDPKINGDDGTYVYMAFAENPFVTSTGVPTTAAGAR